MPDFGALHRHYARTDSTNTRARELAEAGAPHGTVVTAAEQSEGRGRQGRVWTAPAGKGLLYSGILRPLDERHMLLPLAVPIAVCEAAESLRPEAACQIKWPNDVWLEERKLAGILIEARPQDGWAVIGVGVNLSVEPEEFPAELRWPAISLGAGREEARAALDSALDRWVAEDAEAILAEWRARDALRGREVGWSTASEATGAEDEADERSGVADGVDDRGNLLVVVGGGDRVALGAGEVHLRL
jgi:BirA family transcriptional regulator, biotin operon repressor / biotin---[acetyl-CoA-carboxylase] ligase